MKTMMWLPKRFDIASPRSPACHYIAHRHVGVSALIFTSRLAVNQYKTFDPCWSSLFYTVSRKDDDISHFWKLTSMLENVVRMSATSPIPVHAMYRAPVIYVYENVCKLPQSTLTNQYGHRLFSNYGIRNTVGLRYPQFLRNRCSSKIMTTNQKYSVRIRSRSRERDTFKQIGKNVGSASTIRSFWCKQRRSIDSVAKYDFEYHVIIGDNIYYEIRTTSILIPNEYAY